VIASGGRVTVVVVPRDRFSVAQRSLDTLLDRTDVPFQLVYVDGGSPAYLRRYLEVKARARDFTLVRTNRYLSPNEARNLGAAHASTEYIVFLDNDVIVAPGWLQNLVECADATGACVVAPLYLIGELEQGAIHVAGATMHLSGEFGERTLHRVLCLQGQRMNELAELPSRRRCDLAEFHCMLVRRDALAEAGPLDEQLLSCRENEDFCLSVSGRAGGVWFEPKSMVTYLPAPRRPETIGIIGPPLRLSDVPFLVRRWSEVWNRRSLEHLVNKHGLSREYLSQIGVQNAQRQALFGPLRARTRGLFGRRCENGLASVLYRVERVMNRALYR
jgi:GT2 family glycosyltransferase